MPIIDAVAATAVAPQPVPVPLLPQPPSLTTGVGFGGTLLGSATPSSGQTPNYMNLLLAQLKNQDPSSAMNPSDMIAQTTEIGMLQQMTQMESDESTLMTLQMRSTAASLLGKTVSYQDANGSTASGTVSGVSFSGTTPSVTIGDSTVSLGAVLGVAVAPTSPPSPPSQTTTQSA